MLNFSASYLLILIIAMPHLCVVSSYWEFTFSVCDVVDGRDFSEQVRLDLFGRLSREHKDLFQDWNFHLYDAVGSSATFAYRTRTPNLVSESELMSRALCRFTAFQATLAAYMEHERWLLISDLSHPDLFNTKAAPKGEWTFEITV